MAQTVLHCVTSTTIPPAIKPKIFVRFCKTGPHVDFCVKKDRVVNCTYCNKHGNSYKHIHFIASAIRFC